MFADPEGMLLRLDNIIIYSLIAFFLSLTIYPIYIMFLKKLKAGKSIREDASSGGYAEIFSNLHSHKTGTPTMGGGVILFVILILVLFSLILKWMGIIDNSLLTPEETYIILFGFFSMGCLGLIDDFLNMKDIGKIKGLTAKMKLIWMFLFAGFISYWFYFRLGIDYINFWPLGGEIDIGIGFLLLTFVLTLSITNAINITDGLDGLVGGLMVIILFVLGFVTLLNSWFLVTTVIGILLGSLVAFLWFNIAPAKIFMGDSGSLALGGFLASLIYFINIQIGIIIPFSILFLIFIIELSSSALQIFWKKLFKKKLFQVAPFHHLLEHKGKAEYTIVMKFRLIQGVLAATTLIFIFYQFSL